MWYQEGTWKRTKEVCFRKYKENVWMHSISTGFWKICSRNFVLHSVSATILMKETFLNPKSQLRKSVSNEKAISIIHIYNTKLNNYKSGHVLGFIFIFCNTQMNIWLIKDKMFNVCIWIRKMLTCHVEKYFWDSTRCLDMFHTSVYAYKLFLFADTLVIFAARGLKCKSYIQRPNFSRFTQGTPSFVGF
jgi:hypothetical protein